jgi:ribosomal protein S4
MTRNQAVKKWGRWKKFKNVEGREDMQLTSKSWRDSFVEKQAVKAYYYSFNETFMKRLWRSESGKIVNVIKNLESRLTTFLVTNNFAQSPLQAHQWISHKHVKVNNVIVNHPKYMLIAGDVIELDYLAISKNKNWGSRLAAGTTVSCQRDDEGKTWVFDPKTNNIVYLGTNIITPFTPITWGRVKEFYIR